MPSKTVLLKITKTLLARRNELRKRLGMDLGELGYAGGTGDSADAAFGAGGEEMSSQLAQLESKELAQTELALVRIKQGRYGVCDTCEKKIPAARLNAVPYSVMCVTCQSQAERDENWLETHAGFDWADVRDDTSDREFDISTFEAQYAK